MSQSVALAPDDVWRDRFGRTYTILREEHGETFYQRSGLPFERHMKTYLLAFQLGRDGACRESAAPHPVVRGG